MRTILIVTLLIGLGSLTVKSQEVSNVKSRSLNDKIEITYLLSGVSFDQDVTVSLYISQDNGKPFQGPLKEVSGNIGKGIRNGQQTIIWDALKEMPFYQEDLVFEVRTKVEPVSKKPDWMIAAVGNNITPFGLRFGTLRRLGWYIECRSNRYPVETAAYTYSEGQITDFNQPGYFLLNQENHFSAYSVLAGINYQPVRDMFLYAGAGYGKESFLIGMDEFSYTRDQLIRHSQARHKEISYEGVEIDAGIMTRFSILIVSAGITTIDFKTLYWTAGIGLSLGKKN
jgi:hypothetical protein